MPEILCELCGDEPAVTTIPLFGCICKKCEQLCYPNPPKSA